MAEASPYDKLKRGDQLEAFYVDLLIPGPSRTTPNVLSERQREMVRDVATAEIPTADPIELYGQVIEAHANESLRQFAHLLPPVGFQALRGM